MTHGNIDQDHLCRFVLYKQHLADEAIAVRSRLVSVVKDICGLHAQIASTPYLSLFNRIKNFQKGDLRKALYEKRTLVKIWGMRATVHIVATDQVAEYYQATQTAGSRHPLQIDPLHKKILKLLVSKSPLTLEELTNNIPELARRVKTPYGDVSIGAVKLRELTQATLCVPVQPRGDWKSNLHTYANFKTWLPHVDLQSVGETDARKMIIAHYLAGFGPASVDDIVWWLGISKGAVTKTLEAMHGKIDEIEIAGLDDKFIALTSDLVKLRRFSTGSDTCHLLPKFDPYIMGYRNRQRFILAKHEKKVYRSTRAEVAPCVLVNGRIIGTWELKEQNKKVGISLSVFEKPDKRLTIKLAQQAERIARFINADKPEICFLTQ